MEHLADHPLVVLSSFLCTLGVVIYCFRSTLVHYVGFTMTYLVGICFWLSYGLEIGSYSISMGAFLQVLTLLYVLTKTIKVRLHES